MLVPQALEGVAAVGLLYATVKRWFGPGGRARSPARCSRSRPSAALMFRFNNPDALLVLLLVGAAYAMTRALEHGSTRCGGARAGAASASASSPRMLQAFLVLPAFALVYLVAAPTVAGRRIGQLCSPASPLSWCAPAGGSRSSQLWPAVVPPVHRRLAEQQLPRPDLRLQRFRPAHRQRGRQRRRRWRAGGRATGAPTGLTRMFESEIGSQISWLLPAALVLLVAGSWVTRRAPRTDRTRAALLLWGGWLLVTGVVFSSARASSTRTTRSRSPRRSARSSPSERAHLWAAPRRSTAARSWLAALVASARGWAPCCCPARPWHAVAAYGRARRRTAVAVR